MNEEEAKQILKKDLNFSENNINNLEIFRIMLIEYNAKYNLISKSTENSIWSRHILDSAQLLKYFNVSSGGVLADLGSGAGFPGLVLAIFIKNQGAFIYLIAKLSTNPFGQGIICIKTINVYRDWFFKFFYLCFRILS